MARGHRQWQSSQTHPIINQCCHGDFYDSRRKMMVSDGSYMCKVVPSFVNIPRLLSQSCVSLCRPLPRLFLYYALLSVLSPLGHSLWLGAFLEVSTWKHTLLPPFSSSLSPMPFCLGHTTPPMINRSQWEVWTLTFLKNIEDRKQGCRAHEIADVGRLDTLSAGLWEALGGLKDALSCQDRLVGCYFLNSITSHIKS